MIRRFSVLLVLTGLGLVSLGLTSSGHVEIFNSPLSLKVFVRMAADVPDRVLGFTPVAKGHRIRVNPGTFWYVRPDGRLTAHKLERLAADIRRYGIPGVDLSDHWELTDELIEPLRDLHSLRMLDLSRTRLTKAAALTVATLKTLTILSVPESFNDHSLSLLKTLTGLRDLNLDRTHVTDEGLRSLLSHPLLESLDLSGTAVTDEGLTVLKGLPHLKHLVLSGRITNAGAPALQAIHSLRNLDISQTQITDDGLSALATLPHLESIYLNRSISDAGLEHLSTSRSLQSLDLSGSKITSAGLQALSKIQTLQELDVSQTPVDDVGLSTLSKLPNLRMLEISDTHVTNMGLAPLAKLRHLEILSLSWQRLTRADLRAMGRLPQVKTMVLNGVPLSEPTMRELRRLDHASPWEHATGLAEVSPPAPAAPTAQTLAAPWSASNAVVPTVALPASARSLTAPLSPVRPVLEGGLPGLHVNLPRSAPASRTFAAKSPRSANNVDALQAQPSPEPATVVKKTHATENILVREPLKEKANAYALTGAELPHANPTEDMTVAEGKSALPTQKLSEDALLKTIARQSDPSRHGGFSGLSGMRQIRVAQNNSSLSDMDNGAQAKIKMQEDTAANSLGEIDVDAGRSR